MSPTVQQSYNAQAAVDTDTMLVVATGLCQAANDKQQIAPMVETLGALPETLGKVSESLTDAGYFSEANVAACVEAGIDPMIAAGRESHHLPWQERFIEPPPLCEPADAVERMRHRQKTRTGRASYGKRKQTVEPVFGIIKAGCGSGNFCCAGSRPYEGSGRW